MRHPRRLGLAGRLAILLMMSAAAWPGNAGAIPIPPAPGTTFVSDVTVSYIDSATGIAVHLSSNTVVTTVQPLEAVRLTASQTANVAPSGSVVFAHQLTNVGNIPTTYKITVSAAPGAFTPTGLTLVGDTNGNGVADAGEPILASGALISLASGATSNLLVLATVPGSATVGQSAQITLSATGQSAGESASDVDILNAAGPTITLTKTASTSAPGPNGTLSYTLTAQNRGALGASPIALTIDSQTASLIVMRDAVPANTTFAAASSSTPGVRVLFHRAGDPANGFVSSSTGSQIDGVAWAATTLAPAATLSGTLGVTVNANAAGTLNNTGYVGYSFLGSAISIASNPVNLTLPPLAPTIAFYTSNVYSTPAHENLVGAALFVQINAAQCNTDPTTVLTHAITLASALTGDSENFTATETAPNTGIFRVNPAIKTAAAAARTGMPGNGILEVTANDRVIATLTGCGAATTSAQLLIDPAGFVFDSKTNAAVIGASVALIDVSGAGNGGQPGAPAAVLAADGITPAPSTVVTGSDGSYRFPWVAPSTYKLQVVPPSGLVFPSKVAQNALPAGHVVTTASYGANFTVSGSSGPITTNIPLDAGAVAGLFVQKTASKTVAAVGDFVDYSITLTNGSGATLTALVLDDDLPAGFAFIPGTARLNGVALTNPVGGAGPRLQFGIGTVAAQAPSVLTYRVRIGPAGSSGTGTNTAQAQSGPTRSNIASVTVKIAGSALSDKAYLIGKVYADCNQDGLQQPDEPGVPGVRIYLDNGDFVITDDQGKYSLYGLTPRTYVAKLDTTSLPAGASLRVLDNRNALDAGSQFVDLQNGELHKTDFALASCDATLLETITARRKAQGSAHSEVATLAVSQLNINAVTVPDPRTQSASGVIGQRVQTTGEPPAGLGARTASSSAAAGAPGATGAAASVATGSTPAAAGGGTQTAMTAPDLTPADDLAPAAAAGRPVAESLAEQLRTLTPELAFLDLADGAVVPAGQTRVRLKGAIGSQLTLSVNGNPVGLSQVGERSSLERTGVTAWEYVGVDLTAGDNRLQASMVDPFGNTRATRNLHLIAPGPLARVAIGAPTGLIANAEVPIDITVELRDDNGVRIFSRTELTLETTLGEWQTPDMDPQEPGIQVFVEGGIGHFKLLPPADPGKGRLRVTSGALRADRELTFLPNLRPLLVAGVAEGVVNLHNLSPNSLVPARSGDAFEREIQSASRSFDSGSADAAARVSLFLKGKILGANLLTLAYDSDKPTDTPLFRDIQPDQFYPVYGDSSVKGYDAQSTGKLYVRVDHGTSSVLYGDFSTQSDNPARVLTQYSRALNGAKTHVEDGRLTVDGFASYTSSTQVIDELPANGTSGPYQLSQHDPVLNSQRVDIITRDRDQPTLVLSDTPLTAFTDYAIDEFSGQILLKAPVPSLDSNLNPLYVRVVYEVNTDGPKYWVGGVDLREKLAPSLTLGGTFVRDSNPITRDNLGGANFLWAPDRETSLVGEVAASQSDLIGTGGGHRIEFKHNDARVQARVYAVQTDSTFNNPSSTYTAGAAEYGAKISAAFDARNRLLIDAIKTTTAGTSIQSPLSIPVVGVPETLPGGGSRQGESIAWEHTLVKNLKLTSGLRHVESNGDATQALAIGAVPNDYTSARVRVDAPVPALPKATVFAQYERAIDDGGARDTTVGGTYQVAPQTKWYATHQTSNSLSGDYALNPSQQNDTTVVGLDTAYMQDGKMFDEYRIGDGIDGREARAAVGLRNLWSLAPGLGLSTSIQQVHPISGVVTDRATALTGALEYTASPDWKASTRVEWSKSATAETWLSNIGAAFKVNSSITALLRAVYDEQLGLGQGAASNTLRQEQLGFAFRPVHSDEWNALAWVEHKRTDNGTLGVGLDVDEAANIFSSHVNYQPTATWVITGRYGVKQATDYSSGINSTYTAQIVGARSVWDLTERWDAGVQYFIEYGGNGIATRQQAIGGEIGYLVIKNLWLSLGYNLLGFRDADLASEDYTQHAFYLRMRFKFDENLFKPNHNTDPIPATAAVMK